MYRAQCITSGLANLLGWRQNYDTEAFTISDSLTTSLTSRFYQDIHPLLTLDNIKSIAPDFKRVNYPAWSSETQYRVGDRVQDGGGNRFRAKKPSLNLEPETAPDNWERFDSFSEWLEQKTNASIIKAISTFWDQKMAEKTLKNLLEKKPLFNGAGRIYDLVESGSNWVGFELVPIRANGVTVKIEKIGLQFTGESDVTLYLMHSSSLEPIKTIQVHRSKSQSIEWFDQTDLFLTDVSESTDSGGSYYLIYKQSALPEGIQAVNKNKDWSAKPCTSCDQSDFASWNIWSKYLEIHPFKINPEEPDQDTILWDVAKNLYTYNTNYGINLQISIECDVTDLIIGQKYSFQNMIGLQVAVDMIREMAYNPNFNIGRTQQNFSRMELLYELDGDSTGTKKSGLVYQLDQAMKAMSIDTTELSRVCFPCGNKGVKYRTV